VCYEECVLKYPLKIGISIFTKITDVCVYEEEAKLEIILDLYDNLSPKLIRTYNKFRYIAIIITLLMQLSR